MTLIRDRFHKQKDSFYGPARDELILLPLNEYKGVDRDDPIRQYGKPIFGRLYRKRVEICLHRCRGGKRILEVGFGSGVSFLNLARKYEEIHGIDLKSNVEEITRLFASKGIQVYLKQGTLLQLPYAEGFFDTVLLISILEHLRPEDLTGAFEEIHRVLRPGGQMVYGVPAENKITRLGFLALGYDIRKHHFSSERQVQLKAQARFTQGSILPLLVPILGFKVYEIGEFAKT